MTIENNFIDYCNFNDRYLECKEPDLPHKKILLNIGSTFEDIIEIEKDKYILLSDNNLIIATFNENLNNYEYQKIPDLKCLMIQKLKSGKILLINELNVNLMKFKDNQLIIIKSQTISLPKLYQINIRGFKFLSYELLNGKIVFTIDDKRFCYFNIKTFQIKFVFNLSEKGDNEFNFIKKFNQIKDKNILYCLIQYDGCYKINLKNGKIEKQLINFAESINIDKYLIIKKNSDTFIINDEKNNQLFNKKLEALDELILINENSKIFATMGWNQFKDYIYTYIFKINIK